MSARMPCAQLQEHSLTLPARLCVQVMSSYSCADRYLSIPVLNIAVDAIVGDARDLGTGHGRKPKVRPHWHGAMRGFPVHPGSCPCLWTG